MNQEEILSELGQPGAVELLHSSQPLRLAYTARDGFPRVIPIGFNWNGEEVVLSTAPTAPKVRDLAADPHVAITIDEGETPETARSLLIRGVARLSTVNGLTEDYVAASAKSLDAQELDEFTEQAGAMHEQMVRIAITPGWARYFEFGTGRWPKFLRELAND